MLTKEFMGVVAERWSSESSGCGPLNQAISRNPSSKLAFSDDKRRHRARIVYKPASMRVAAVLVALSAALSSAGAGLVSRQTLPASCTTSANPDGCLCRNQSFVSAVTTCIKASRSGSDLQQAEEFAQSLCLAVGVTLTISTSTATSASSATSTSFTSSSATSSYGINVFAAAAAVLGVVTCRPSRETMAKHAKPTLSPDAIFEPDNVRIGVGD
ncbi:hypothetical protein EDD15DRAFT_2198387 [Pisolithus albus]|nr:hypothetical protein EDD15DRAFT_2198387 [Pisolithus albus]